MYPEVEHVQLVGYIYPVYQRIPIVPSTGSSKKTGPLYIFPNI